MASDPLDDVFNLEDRFYREGYQQGLDDGDRAGRVEGRSFGMDKGFEKFLQAGRLAARSVVWANRNPGRSAVAPNDGDGSSSCSLPKLPAGARLQKNVATLYALVEPGTLSTANTDTAVQDFDDRVRRAQGKVKVVERMVGTGGKESQGEASTV
jgi:hypothetical protein